METIEKKSVVEALQSELGRVLAKETNLPLLTEKSHAQLISLRCVAMILNLRDVTQAINQLIDADTAAMKGDSPIRLCIRCQRPLEKTPGVTDDGVGTCNVCLNRDTWDGDPCDSDNR